MVSTFTQVALWLLTSTSIQVLLFTIPSVCTCLVEIWKLVLFLLNVEHDLSRYCVIACLICCHIAPTIGLLVVPPRGIS